MFRGVLSSGWRLLSLFRVQVSPLFDTLKGGLRECVRDVESAVTSFDGIFRGPLEAPL